LKKVVLTFDFDPLGSRARLCACSLLSGSLDVSISLKEKVLTWSVDIRGREQVYVLGVFTRDLQSSFFSFLEENVLILKVSFL